VILNNNFDYFRNLKRPEIFLCNPDKEKLAVLQVLDAQLTLRFNDLSELTLEVPSRTTNARGKRIKYEHYNSLRAKRLILVDGVGYFRIMEVDEIENGLNSYKQVKASSLQIRLNDKGFFIEERVYKFFDPRNPYDEGYYGTSHEEMPSVVGQLYQQLNIHIDPRVIQGLNDLGQTYDDWTISYINPALRFNSNHESKFVRSFTEQKTLWCYEFIMNYASQTFEVIFIFDFLRHSIHIKTVDEVTERTNIYLSYDNVVNELQTNERMDELVTVLNCNGNNLNIQAVNPTGTNYIADFTYFMSNDDGEYPKWMSKELSQKLREWEVAVEEATPEWTQLVTELRQLYLSNTEIKAGKVKVDKRILDLENALGLWAQAHSEGVVNELKNLEQLERARAIFTAEDIRVGSISLDEASTLGIFDRDTVYTCYQSQPTFISGERETDDGETVWSGSFSFEGQPGRRATFNDNYLFGSTNPQGVPQTEPLGGFIYFPDPVSNDNTSYCKLYGEVYQIYKPDPATELEEFYEAHFWVAGFERYTTFNNAWLWLEKYQGVSRTLQEEIDANNEAIEVVKTRMKEISSVLNLQRIFDLSSPDERKLFFELKRYWIENDYTNSGLAVLETTTPEEAIDLARELLEEGRKHLAKNSQPRFSICVDAIDFTKIHVFKAFSSELALGKVITIKKNEQTHYYPALTAISLNLVTPNNFLLEFSNALRPDSKDFLFADLINEGVSSARTVSANWQNLTQFNRESKTIYDLLREPLNRTLRVAQGSMSNQQFVVDDTGILGRRFKDDTHSSFESEQIRIINNILLFTNDSWQTAKTALGKINFNHPMHGETQAYGLLAEALVGSVIIGNTLFISNKENTITLDDDGIRIKRPSNNEITFHAKPNGDVYIKGNIDAVSGRIGGLTLSEGNLVSDNFEIITAEDNLTRLVFKNADGIETTQVGDTGVFSPHIEGSNLTAGETLRVGGFGGLKIDNHKIATDNPDSTYISFNAGSSDSRQIVATVSMPTFNTMRIVLDQPLMGAATFGVALRGSWLGTIGGGWNRTELFEMAAGATLMEMQITLGLNAFVSDFFFGDTGTRTRAFTQAISTKNIEMQGSFVPSQDSMYSLGSDDKKWNEIHTSKLYLNGRLVYVGANNVLMVAESQEENS